MPAKEILKFPSALEYRHDVLKITRDGDEGAIDLDEIQDDVDAEKSRERKHEDVNVDHRFLKIDQCKVHSNASNTVKQKRNVRKMLRKKGHHHNGDGGPLDDHTYCA